MEYIIYNQDFTPESLEAESLINNAFTEKDNMHYSFFKCSLGSEGVEVGNETFMAVTVGRKSYAVGIVQSHLFKNVN